jgi:hypothetical protein
MILVPPGSAESTWFFLAVVGMLGETHRTILAKSLDFCRGQYLPIRNVQRWEIASNCDGYLSNMRILINYRHLSH